MSTTIDSLAIEIQSNSSGAVADIERLAGALEKISKSTVSKTAVKNLKDLTDALKGLTPVTSNAKKLSDLADSLSKLTAVGSIRGLTNQLKELPAAMSGLSGINVDAVAPQISRIAVALAPLSKVKGGGFNSMITGLSKLGSVTKSLDSDTIDNFVERIKELNDKLAPVAKNLIAVGNAFKTVGSDATKAGGKVNTTTLNLQSAISVAKSVLQVLKKVANLLIKTIGDALEWDGIAQRFGRGFGENAEEVYSWVQRLNKEMGINTQQFMQYSSTYATMLTGFGVASKDASKMALGYMELTYDIWSGYNDIYKSLDDAATAVRSAIAGEVEPVRKAGFTIIESTLEQTAANHGLKISLEKATEAQKSYLRYLTLVDQAKAQGLVGNYAREMNTAEGAVRTFTQQLKSLAQTFGSIFLPVLVKVMPWVQAFIELVGDAIMAAAAFFNIDIQKVDFSGSVGGLGDSADSATSSVKDTTKAMKELKNATTGIDELNIISPQSGSGSSGGSGSGWDGPDISSLWDESIFDQIQFEVDAIKEQLKEALSGITTVVGGFALAIGTILVLCGSPKTLPIGIALMAAGAVGLAAGVALNWGGMSKQLAGTLVDVTSVLSGFLLAIGAFLAFSGVKVGLGIALMAAGAVSLATAAVINWKFLEGDLKSTVSLLTGIVSGGLLAMGALFAFTGVAVGLGIGLMLAGAVGLAATVSLNWDAMTEPMRKKIGTIEAIVGGALLAIGAILAFTGVGIPLGIGLMAAGAASLIAGVALNWNSIVNSIKKVLKKIGIIAGAAMLALGVILCLTGVGIPLGIGLIAVGAASLAAGVALNWDSVKNAVKKAINAIKNWAKKYGLLALGIILCLTGAGIPLGIALIKKGLDTKTENGSTVGNDLLNTIKEKWAAIKKWWNSKPALKKVSAKIEDFKSKVSDAWSAAKTWWTKNVSLKLAPTVSSIKDKLSSAWTAAKTWWNNNVKLSIPSLSLKVTYETQGLGVVKNAIVKALGLQGWPKLSFAANGGIFDMGSLVWAGEAGPEIVANAGGGKTGVMNVHQMSEAVYEGVYAAVVAAMRANGGNGGSQAVNVYLDGKQITASVEQRQKERGASLLGSQVYGYG